MRRKELSAHLGNEVAVHAFLYAMGERDEQSVNALLYNLSVNGRPLDADHLWLTFGPTASERLTRLAPDGRGMLRFRATVGTYPEEGGSYCLIYPRETELWSRGRWRTINRSVEEVMNHEESARGLVSARERALLAQQEATLQALQLMMEVHHMKCVQQALRLYAEGRPLKEGHFARIQGIVAAS